MSQAKAVSKQQEIHVVRNCSIINSRTIEPVYRSFGGQYTLLVSGHGLDLVTKGKSNEDGSVWLNQNATYPNGDPTGGIEVVTKALKPFDKGELGEGTLVDLLFNVVRVKKEVYYNIRTIRVLDHIAPFNHLSAFGEDDTDDVNEGDF
jgi:hypothetical protein|tara:strand:+ start:6399 stop:6842 length:444 start_codon:yes stop_codon:yes gene_type:complete